MSRYSTLCGISVAFLMKLCHKIVEIQFGSLDPSHFYAEANATTGNQECGFNSSVQPNKAVSTATAWIYTTRYMLPVLGGVMSSAWLGYVRVLQIGGGIMLLATGLLSAAVYHGLICQSSAIIPITWLLLPLFFGLTQPNILYAFFLWYNQAKMSTVIPAFYYFAATLGWWVACLLAPLSDSRHLGNHFPLIFTALSFLFISLSHFLPEDSNREHFEMPTRSRMTRYFQIFSGLILILFSLSDIRATVYMEEITHFSNGSTYLAEYTWLSPQWVYLITMWASSLILALTGYFGSRKFPVHWRLQAGILLKSAVALSLLIFTACAKTAALNSTTVAVVYSAASAMDGLSEMLVIIAAYDIVQQISPRSSKALVFGIVFTEWGLANIVSRFWIFAIGHAPYFAYHLVTLVALLISLFYHRHLSLPLTEQMKIADEPDEASESINEGPESERQLLLRQQT